MWPQGLIWKMFWPEECIKRSKCAEDGRDQFRCSPIEESCRFVEDKTIFVAHAISNAEIRDIPDNSNGCRIHKTESTNVVRLLKLILDGEPAIVRIRKFGRFEEGLFQMIGSRK